METERKEAAMEDMEEIPPLLLFRLLVMQR
jgi:hypothetical protein